MIRYVFKRILIIIPIMLAVSLIVFSIMELVPGNPATIILGDTATAEAITQITEEYGFDDPFLVRYFRYMTNLAQGNFGASWKSGRPVIEEISSRFPVTLNLALLGVFFSALIGIPMGVYSAVKQYSFFDNLNVVLATVFAVIPPFAFGLIVMLIFALQLRWLPASGLNVGWKSYILPTLTIAVRQAANIMRFSRSTMLETIRQDYICTARAKGVPEGKVIIVHALKNALLPIVTVLGNIFGNLMGGVVIIESVFAIPGLGYFTLSAIKTKDVPEVMGSIIILSGIFCLIMLVVDVIYAFVDPRIKSNYIKVAKRPSPRKVSGSGVLTDA